MKLNHLRSLFIVLTLVSCGPKGSHTSSTGMTNAGSGGGSGGNHGTVDWGGGNSCQGKTIESYARNIEEQQYYKDLISPLIQNLNTLGLKTFANELSYAVRHKKWYFVPCDLDKISKEKLNTPFETEQYAVQTDKEVYFDSKIFDLENDKIANEKDDENKKKLISEQASEQAQKVLHEMVRGISLLQFVAKSSIDDLNFLFRDGESGNDFKFPESNAINLSPNDYVRTRDLTTYLFNEVRTTDLSKLKPSAILEYGYEGTTSAFAESILSKIRALNFDKPIKPYVRFASVKISDLQKYFDDYNNSIQLFGDYDTTGRANSYCQVALKSTKTDRDNSNIQIHLDYENLKNHQKTVADYNIPNIYESLTSDIVDLTEDQNYLDRLFLGTSDSAVFRIDISNGIASDDKLPDSVTSKAELFFDNQRSRVVAIRIQQVRGRHGFRPDDGKPRMIIPGSTIVCTVNRNINPEYLPKEKLTNEKVIEFEEIMKTKAPASFFRDGIYAFSHPSGNVVSDEYFYVVKGNTIAVYMLDDKDNSYKTGMMTYPNRNLKEKTRIKYLSCESNKEIEVADPNSDSFSDIYDLSDGNYTDGDIIYKKQNANEVAATNARLQKMTKKCLSKSDLDD